MNSQEQEVVEAALAWSHTTAICSCEDTAEGQRLIDATMALEALSAEEGEDT